LDKSNFNDFIKEYNMNLWNNIKNIDYHALFSIKRDNLSFSGFYMYGFDNINDSLNKNLYSIERVTFLKSLSIKGDMVFVPRTIPKTEKVNAYYKLYRDSLLRIEKFPVYEFYKKVLKCDKVRARNFEVEDKTILYRIKGGVINKYFSTFSRNSEEIFEKELKNYKFLNENTVTILKVKALNIEDVECW